MLMQALSILTSRCRDREMLLLLLLKLRLSESVGFPSREAVIELVVHLVFFSVVATGRQQGIHTVSFIRDSLYGTLGGFR